MAFTYTIKGETAGVGGSKKIFGTWDSAGATSGTVTWAGSSTNVPYNVIGANAVYSTTVTTTGLPKIQVTANTLVLGLTDSGAAGYWSVEVQ